MSAEPSEREDTSVPPPRRKRRLGRVFAFVGAFVLVLGVAGVLAFPRIVRATLDRELSRRGLRLSEGTIDVSFSIVAIDGARLVSSEGVTVAIDRVEVDHTWGTPRQARVRGLRVDGDRRALVALQRRLSDVPARVEGGALSLHALELGLPDDTTAEVAFASASQEEGWFVLEGLSLSLAIPGLGERLTLESPSARINPGTGAEMDALSFEAPRPARDDKSRFDVVKVAIEGRGSAEIRGLSYQEGTDRLTFSAVDLEEVRILARPARREIELSVEKLPKQRLARFGIEPPGDVSGKASIKIEDPTTRSAHVAFEATLQGYVPPHPRELNGIVFGDETKVRGVADVRLEGVRPHGKLGDLVVEAGVLTLKGEGTFDDEGLSLDLAGSLGCADLATSALSAHLGFAFGMGTSPISRRFLGGTVAVTLGIKASYATLDRPVISPNAILRCSLRLGL